MKYQVKSNYHTHTFLCKHAEGTPSDYAAKALELGYHTIAISDHGPLIPSILKNFYTRRMSYQQYLDIYLPELEVAKKIHPNIRVLSALEIEYFKEMDAEYQKYLTELDFLILGEHYFHHLGRYYNVYEPFDVDALHAYTNDVIEGIESGYFKIVAHPDIFCWNYPTWDEECEKAAKKIISAAIQHQVVLEINANGIRNSKKKNHVTLSSDGHISYSYPKWEFWKVAKRMNAKVMINDDAHFFKNLLDDATVEAYEMAEELELEIIDDFLK